MIKVEHANKTFSGKYGTVHALQDVSIHVEKGDIYGIIGFSGAFHGRTHCTMAMTSTKAYAKGMGELANGVFRAQFPYYYRNPEGMPQDAALDYYM